MRDSFIFYKSFFDSIKELDPKDQVQIYNAIFEYQFNGEIIDLKGVCKSIFTLIIPQLEANNNKYKNGCKGGRPKKKPNENQKETKTKPKNNLNKTKAKPNDNVNENDNVNDNVIKKENIQRKKLQKPTIEEIQKYCDERNNGINAEAFYDFYESKDWYVGKNKMKDWKACVRTWEKRYPKENAKNIPTWLNKNIQPDTATEQEQMEMERLLKDFK